MRFLRVICKAQERLELLNAGWHWPVLHSFKLLFAQINGNTIFTEYTPKPFTEKGTVAKPCHELVLSQDV